MIYLDNAASTPVDPRVKDMMLPYLDGCFGNPASIHQQGQLARAAIEQARFNLGKAFNCEPTEFIFTSGATEANNLAIKGCAAAYLKKQGKPGRIITAAIEHESVLFSCRSLAEQGWEIIELPVNKEGIVNPTDLTTAITANTALISIMAANNEIGSIQPIIKLGSIAREHAIPFHVDAVQGLLGQAFDLTVMPIDLLSLSAHKIYGPKGVGALYIRRGVMIETIMHGSSQELGRRSGTENLAGIVGLGEALRLLHIEREQFIPQLQTWRDYLLSKIPQVIPHASILGPKAENRLPQTASFLIPEIEQHLFLARLDLAGVCASAGSACASGATTNSHVISALGLNAKAKQTPLRLSLGRFNTAAEIRTIPKLLKEAVNSLAQKVAAKV